MESTAPTQQEIDTLAQMYLDAQSVADQAQESADVLHDQLLDLTARFGFVPPRATKSKRLQGEMYKATLSTSTGVEVDGTRVELFKAKLKAKGLQRYFSKLFQRVAVYMLRDGAQVLASQIAVQNGDAVELHSLFHACLTIDNKAPRLVVEPIKKEKREKES